MSIARRRYMRGHDTAASRQVAGLSPEVVQSFWVAGPGERVMTREGFTGRVEDVLDGPGAASEIYIVALDNGMGGGEYGASEISPLNQPQAAAEHTAAEDYPELAEILAERPPPEDHVHLSKLAATYEDGEQVSDLHACDHYEPHPQMKNVCKNCLWSWGSHPAKGGGPTGHGPDSLHPNGSMSRVTATPDEARDEDWTPEERDAWEAEHAHTAAAPVTDGLGQTYSPEEGLQTQAGPILDKALEWGFKTRILNPMPVNQLPRVVADWCRYRNNAHCFYPEHLNEAATKQAGYAVWVPKDRGHCPRLSWEQQQQCPVGQPGPFSKDPHAQIDATIPWEAGGQRGGVPGAPSTRASLGDPEFGWHFTASWADVRTKAKRIAADGHVRILRAPGNAGLQIVAEVQGDHDLYQTAITRVPGKYAVAMWECGCAWSSYAWGRTGRWKRYEGRMCSHALAVVYAAQREEMFGGELQEARFAPNWRDPSILPKTYYDKDKGRSLSSRHEAEADEQSDRAVPAVVYTSDLLGDGITPQGCLNRLATLGVSDPESVLRRAMALSFPALYQGRHVVVQVSMQGITVNGEPVDATEVFNPSYDPHRGLTVWGAQGGCPACSGTGEQGTGHECYACDGSGQGSDFNPAETNENPANGLLVGRRDDLGIEPVLNEDDDLRDLDPAMAVLLVEAAGSDFGAAARAMLTLAKRNEPATTAAMTQLAGQTGGQMVGLAHRLKGEQRLTEKMQDEAHEHGNDAGRAAAAMSDSLRYTMTFPEESYTAGAQHTLGSLAKQGYKLRVKNFWPAGDDYNGINIAARTPTGHPFELQIHTPQSVGLKENTHKLYEQYRTSEDPYERYHLFDQMRQIADACPQPPNVLGIQTHKMHPSPVNPALSVPQQDLTLAAALAPEEDYRLLTDHDGHPVGLTCLVNDHENQTSSVFVHRDGDWHESPYHLRFFTEGDPRQEKISKGQAAEWIRSAKTGAYTLPQAFHSGDMGLLTANPMLPKPPPQHQQQPGGGPMPGAAGEAEQAAPELEELAPLALASLGDLHDEPEPALPTTDGGDTDDDTDDALAFVGDGSAPAEPAPAISGPGEAVGAETQGVVDPTVVPDQTVPGDLTGISSRAWLMDGDRPAPGSAGDSDIAAAARAHLAKTALKDFSPAEQRLLIEEGLDGVEASNLDLLDIAGTHYEALEAALSKTDPKHDEEVFF